MPNEHDDQVSSNEDSAKRRSNTNGGEDESSAPEGASDGHLRNDQKPQHDQGSGESNQIADDDPHKAEKLTKAGRDIDPNEGSD